MALAHRYVCIYPTGATTTPDTSTASQGDSGVDYSAAYTSMSAMEAAENGDFTTDDGTVLHVEIIDPDGDSDWSGAHDTTYTTFDGWTTDRGGDGSYVEIKSYGTARSSNGNYDTDAYVLDVDGRTLNIDNDHNLGTSYLDIEFDGVQFRQHTSGIENVYLHYSSSLNDIRFLNCYFKAETSSVNFFNALSDDTNLVIRLKNCILDGGTHGVKILSL